MSKRERTRAFLQETALRLFTERGFEDVTVEEIAGAAGVSHMTFYRHFPTKESVVLDDPYDPLMGMAVSQQPANLTALERVRRGLLSVSTRMDDEEDESILSRIRIAIDSPSLRARIWENNHRTEQVIVQALVDTGASSREAHVAAGAVLGAMTAALLRWAREEAPVPLKRCLGDALGQLATETARSS